MKIVPWSMPEHMSRVPGTDKICLLPLTLVELDLLLAELSEAPSEDLHFSLVLSAGGHW